MLYSEASKALFLEIPKTGTVALSGALKGVCTQVKSLPRHASAKQARRDLGNAEWSKTQTIAVIREPTSWLQSWYRYLVGNGRVSQEIPFAEFIARMADDEIIDGKRIRVGSQFDRVADGRGRRVIVGELLCFEHLADEYNRVNKAVLGGAGAFLAPKNVSPRVNIDSSNGLEDFIRERWAKDFEVWEPIKRRADLTHASQPVAETPPSARPVAKTPPLARAANTNKETPSDRS